MEKYIDLMDLVRLGHEVHQQNPLSRFLRLTEDLPEQTDENQVSWSIKGHQKPHGPALVKLSITANPRLQCQRCMKLFNYDVASEVELQVVTSERAFNADVSESGEIDNDAYEKILANKPVDMLALVEDELILSLPYIPKHDICPELAEMPEDNLEKKPSPFAVLEKLKH
ncbi:DUF177 domain-containing protein [Pelistega sp. MC2]|uniref:YceD family protein n=1 Tax=Pelistega sp. MC2 TaxID=1720297 RepID=UPI000AC0C834|nr:YceD family protein [Pelistega sp. MC2]